MWSHVNVWGLPLPRCLPDLWTTPCSYLDVCFGWFLGLTFACCNSGGVEDHSVFFDSYFAIAHHSVPQLEQAIPREGCLDIRLKPMRVQPSWRSYLDRHVRAAWCFPTTYINSLNTLKLKSFHAWFLMRGPPSHGDSQDEKPLWPQTKGQTRNSHASIGHVMQNNIFAVHFSDNDSLSVFRGLVRDLFAILCRAKQSLRVARTSHRCTTNSGEEYRQKHRTYKNFGFYG